MLIAAFPSHCGSKIFHDLYNLSDDTRLNLTAALSKQFHKTAFAIFVDHPGQRCTYELLKKKFKILYQSPILKNPSTDNPYFIVIYLNEEP